MKDQTWLVVGLCLLAIVMGAGATYHANEAYELRQRVKRLEKTVDFYVTEAGRFSNQSSRLSHELWQCKEGK